MRALSLSNRPSQRLRRFGALVAVLAALAGVTTTNASATYWSWGYNYMGSGVNANVTGSWTYWVYGTIDKNSGGQIAHGWNTAASCYEYMSGSGYWLGFPSDTGSGCGGYLQRFAQWTLGSTSYLFFDSTT